MSTAVRRDDDRTTAGPTPPRHSRGDRVRTVLRGLSQTLITVGLIALLFVVYQLWVTDLLAARAQDQLTEQVREEWADAPTTTRA
ncbi:class E sortase [Blastococcus atacamensis]|uniref:hypothetical protein n=1 Tax=Blastococcus atacamensis TaxID=2070508 RepID=UPI000CEBF027|nr:hypothetical protein [Blastococcus atacamensis]